jgi:hypothetical protein
MEPVGFYEDEGEMPCTKCLGSGYFSDCFDDMCHGEEECIHGDPAECSECKGEGVIYFSGEPAAGPSAVADKEG